MANEIARTPVESGALHSIGYDHETETLAVQFKRGGVHHYLNVPYGAYQAFEAAESKGKHFHENILGKFTSERFDG